MTVALDTVITPELRDEGLAREFINRVQSRRKEEDFNVTDRIRVVCDTESPALIAAVQRFMDYVKSETLTMELIFGPVDASVHPVPVEIDDIKATIGVAVAG